MMLKNGIDGQAPPQTSETGLWGIGSPPGHFWITPPGTVTGSQGWEPGLAICSKVSLLEANVHRTVKLLLLKVLTFKAYQL